MTTPDEAKADEVHGHFVRLEKLGLMVDRVQLPGPYMTALKRTKSIRKHEGRWKLWGAPVRLGPKVEVVAADPITFEEPRRYRTKRVEKDGRSWFETTLEPFRPEMATLSVSARGKVTVKTTRVKRVWVPV